MNRVGIISYNIYCNFTNYGSALQSWALSESIKKFDVEPILIAYCPDNLADKNPLNPFANMKDKDEESRRMCELSLPAIRENYRKFDKFYRERFFKSDREYTSSNFDDSVLREKLSGFVCGSDTIFCISEFEGFDDGYFANYPSMKGKSISYAASFGDAEFADEDTKILNNRLHNFLALGIREQRMIGTVSEMVDVPVERTIDPTLLLTDNDYDEIAADRLIEGDYLLLYSRRYNPEMEKYAERIAKEKNLQIVEISLRATNAEKGHIMYYQAGVEEFLSLEKYASVVVTNSFHGLIFAVQYRRPLAVFSRDQADNKIDELIDLMNISSCKISSNRENIDFNIDYEKVHAKIENYRIKSMEFLKNGLNILLGQ